MYLQNTVLIAFFICLSLSLRAQDRARKWGDIPESDLKMTVYAKDSSASSVVLQDVGKLVMTLSGKVSLYRSRRLKVLDERALDKGNLMIPYRDLKYVDDLRDLEVQVTAPDGTRHTVQPDNVFTEKISSRWSARKVFIPDLKKGSVIEYRYELRAGDMLMLNEWYFQEDIPVRWSELEVSVPKYYDYIVLLNTDHPFDLDETSQGIQTNGQYGVTNRWGLADLPAIKDEPYTTSVDDYRSSVKFQLRSILIPDELPKTIISNWEELAKELNDHDYFGIQFRKSAKFEKIWEAFQSEVTPDKDPEVMAGKIFRFVSSNIKWDGTYSIFSDKNLDDAFEKKSGGSGDLNLLLVALMRKSGLKASPLLLSTRSNGKMYPLYPFVTQFNSVVAALRTGDRMIMYDATNPFLPPDQLNDAHYHGDAWVMDVEKPEWLKITAPEAAQNWYGKMQLSETGEIAGTFQVQTTNNFATNWRTALRGVKPVSFIRKNFATQFSDIQLDSLQFTDAETPEKPLSVKFNCRVPSAASVVNDFIYCQPIVDFVFAESPFKSLTRDFPVEFLTPFRAQYVADLVFPPGYTLEELPAPARVNLPNNGGKMTFNCSKNATGIQVILKMNIAKTSFGPEEYSALRQFYEIVAEKTQVQLALKKT